jgi:hypothetical protein
MYYRVSQVKGIMHILLFSYTPFNKRDKSTNNTDIFLLVANDTC